MVIFDLTRPDSARASVLLCHAKLCRASPSAVSAAILQSMSPDEVTPPMQNPKKNPEDWATGKEPMTGPQRSYLQTLCREAGEEFNEK